MNRRELAEFVCKSLSLFIFAYAAFFAVGAVITTIFLVFSWPFREWTDWSDLSISLILMILTATSIIVGVFYWKKSEWIAGLMADDDPEPVANLPLTLQDVMLVAFSVSGIFILLHGVKETVSVIFILHEFGDIESQFFESPRTWSALIELGFGLWLLLGSHGIVQAIRWLRTAGHVEPEGDASLAELRTDLTILMSAQKTSEVLKRPNN